MAIWLDLWNLQLWETVDFPDSTHKMLNPLVHVAWMLGFSISPLQVKTIIAGEQKATEVPLFQTAARAKTETRQAAVEKRAAAVRRRGLRVCGHDSFAHKGSGSWTSICLRICLFSPVGFNGNLSLLDIFSPGT